MPMTIFTCKKEPDRLLEYIRSIKPPAVIKEAADGGWSATLKVRTGVMRKKQLIINYDPAYSQPPEWDVQKMGMKNFFSDFSMPDERMTTVQRMIDQFQMGIGLVDDPPVSGGDDPRLEVMHGLASLVDGVFFVPSGFLDAEFRTLVHADGSFDEEAIFPKLAEGEVSEGAFDEDEGVAIDVDPPRAPRVAARMYCLLAGGDARIIRDEHQHRK